MKNIDVFNLLYLTWFNYANWFFLNEAENIRFIYIQSNDLLNAIYLNDDKYTF